MRDLEEWDVRAGAAAHASDADAGPLGGDVPGVKPIQQQRQWAADRHRGETIDSTSTVRVCLLQMKRVACGAFQGASVLAYFSFALAMGTLVIGIDLCSSTKNTLHIMCHFLGGLMLSRMVIYNLRSVYLWYVVLLAHAPTSVCTLDSLVHLFILKNSRQRY